MSLSIVKQAIHSPRKALARLILGKKFWEESVFDHTCIRFKYAKTATELLMIEKHVMTHEHYATFKILNHILKLNRILEIGVDTGDSSIALLESVIRKGGFVTSIDLRSCDIAQQRIKKLGYDKHWNFIQSDSLKVNWTEPIDHLYIDGLHTYEQVSKELKKFEPFVKKNGIITIHDIALCDMVRNAILDYIKNRSDLEYFEYYNCFGLGVIFKS